jgi:uncharacterized protein YkwD
VLTIVNQLRAAGATCGGTFQPPVAPLTMNANLQNAARAHSQDMATNNYFSHTSQNGATFDQRIWQSGFTGGFPLGENIAGGASSAQAAVDGWMQSPGHCRNIMNGSYRAIGVGKPSPRRQPTVTTGPRPSGAARQYGKTDLRL